MKALFTVLIVAWFRFLRAHLANGKMGLIKIRIDFTVHMEKSLEEVLSHGFVYGNGLF